MNYFPVYVGQTHISAAEAEAGTAGDGKGLIIATKDHTISLSV